MHQSFKTPGSPPQGHRGHSVYMCVKCMTVFHRTNFSVWSQILYRVFPLVSFIEHKTKKTFVAHGKSMPWISHTFKANGPGAPRCRGGGGGGTGISNNWYNNLVRCTTPNILMFLSGRKSSELQWPWWMFMFRCMQMWIVLWRQTMPKLSGMCYYCIC